MSEQETFQCPRGSGPNSVFQTAFTGANSTWDLEDNTCSYCGSLNPDEFMRRLEANDVDLGYTDKNYKVYLHNKDGEPFKQHYRECPPGALCKGPNDCTHWTTRTVRTIKFYFQHLSKPQRVRFVELINERGYNFYVLPFFVVRGKK